MAVFNLILGGGVPSQTAFAAISVKYKVGAVCTCSDGVITLTAPDTTGEYVFPIPYAGNWTVFADISATVTITTQYQFETIDLTEVVEVSRSVLTLAQFRGSSYMTYVNNQGSASITEEGDDYFRLYTGNTSSYREWVRKVGVDVTNFSQMRVVGNRSGGNTAVGLSTSSTSVANTAGVISIASTTDVDLTSDISGITGTRYIYFRGLMSYIYIKSVSFLR